MNINSELTARLNPDDMVLVSANDKYLFNLQHCRLTLQEGLVEVSRLQLKHSAISVLHFTHCSSFQYYFSVLFQQVLLRFYIVLLQAV